MRLDRFLWWSRLAKTRGVAQALAESGSFRIDGRRIERAHCPVRVGDILTFMGSNSRVRVVRVLALPRRRGPAPEAQECYRDLGENVSQEASGD
jgi:ribosome-associated heat shock protein Hsp15